MPDQPDVPPPTGWAQDEDEKTLWSRITEAFAGDAPPAGEVPPPPPPPVSGPRKIQRTVFDREKKKAESRRTRLRRVAREKREGLALVVGEKVEKGVVDGIKVLVERIQPRDEELSRVAGGLAGLGERTVEQTETLRGIQHELRGQGDVHERVAQSVESVPDLVALVKRGTTGFEDVRTELAVHREQRERVIEGVARVEKALALVADRLVEVQAQRAEDNERFERSLAVVSARAQEQTSAILNAQEGSAETFREVQRALVDAVEESQRRTQDAIERLEEERRRVQEERQRIEDERRRAELEREAEREAERALGRRRTRSLAMLAAPLLLGLLGGMGWFAVETERSRTSAAVTEERSRVEAAIEIVKQRPVAPVTSARVAAVATRATTLPAGFAK